MKALIPVLWTLWGISLFMILLPEMDRATRFMLSHTTGVSFEKLAIYKIPLTTGITRDIADLRTSPNVPTRNPYSRPLFHGAVFGMILCSLGALMIQAKVKTAELKRE